MTLPTVLNPYDSVHTQASFNELREKYFGDASYVSQAFIICIF